MDTKKEYSRTRQIVRLPATLIAVALACAGAAAQAPPAKAPSLADSKPKLGKAVATVGDKDATKTPAAAAAKAHKQLKLGGADFSGSLRLRVENYGWFDAPGFEDDYTFGAAVLRLSLGQKREKLDWLVEGEFPVLVNL